VSQIFLGRCSCVVEAQSESVVDVSIIDAEADFEAIFHAQYERVARVIAGVIKDPARAEELAVEVFLKWSKQSGINENPGAWLYRAAVRTGLNELRQQTRRSRREGVFGGFFSTRSQTPEDVLAASQEQDKVRLVLSALKPRQAELLVLRSHDLTYEELATALALHPASIGTLLSRAEQAFRKEYIRRYGKESHGEQ
jgi:RNA polymerase sigma-70 factor (ECF subfamily)